MSAFTRAANTNAHRSAQLAKVNVYAFVRVDVRVCSRLRMYVRMCVHSPLRVHIYYCAGIACSSLY